MVVLSRAIRKLVAYENLSEEHAAAALDVIMRGDATPAQIAGFLVALRMKGETVAEMTGCARTMRRHALTIRPRRDPMIDIVGTGGDGVNTFNISTAAAFVAAGAGAAVAKHGNRAVSSRCGSADVLEALHIPIDLEPGDAQRCIEETGIGFLYAPRYHKAMRHAFLPRQELGLRTIFNILGPLTNPAPVQGYVLGVYSANLVPHVADVLVALGVERAFVVHGSPGMDEFSVSGETVVAEIDRGRVQHRTVLPEDVGLPRSAVASLMGGTAEDNAARILAILTGVETGPPRDVVVLNAGAGLVVAGLADNLKDGVAQAKEAIEDGRAHAAFVALQQFARGRAA